MCAVPVEGVEKLVDMIWPFGRVVECCAHLAVCVCGISFVDLEDLDGEYEVVAHKGANSFAEAAYSGSTSSFSSRFSSLLTT